MHMGFWWGDGKERNHSEDLGMHGRIILKWILRNMMGMRGLNLCQDTVKCWAVVNTVMNRGVL